MPPPFPNTTYHASNNNITHSLALACARLGINFNCASPPQHTMDRDVVALANEFAAETGAVIGEFTDATEAVTGSDVVYVGAEQMEPQGGHVCLCFCIFSLSMSYFG